MFINSMRKFGVVIVFFNLIGCFEIQSNRIAILQQVKENYDSFESIKYEINYRIKFLDRMDTSHWQGNVILQRIDNDTLFGGMVWFGTKEGIERFYNLSNIFSIYQGKNEVIVYNLDEIGISQISDHAAGALIDVGFLKSDKFIKDMSLSDNNSTIQEDNKHIIISIRYTDYGHVKNKERKIWIRKDTPIIEKITLMLNVDDNVQYQEWNVSRIELNSSKTYPLSKKLAEYQSKYRFTAFKEEEVPDLLTNGVEAPTFDGIVVQDNEGVSLKDYYGQPILLDFSYVSCQPCIDAVPYLVNLQAKFKNLKVLSINSIDIDSSRRSYLNHYITKYSINYPIIITDHSVDSIYHVTGYPTVYLLNNSGRIVYSSIGIEDKKILTLAVSKLAQ